MHRRISTPQHLRQDLAASSVATSSTTPAAGRPLVVRQLPLDPAAIIHWFLIQVLHGNTALTSSCCRPRLPPALCQARARLRWPSSRPSSAVVKILVPATEVAGLWFGHRVLLIDGSSFSMPDVAACKPTSASRATRPRAAASGGPHPGVVPRRHRAAAGVRGAVARDMARGRDLP